MLEHESEFMHHKDGLISIGRFGLSGVNGGEASEEVLAIHGCGVVELLHLFV